MYCTTAQVRAEPATARADDVLVSAVFCGIPRNTSSKCLYLAPRIFRRRIILTRYVLLSGGRP
jgi:hypothetical protein